MFPLLLVLVYFIINIFLKSLRGKLHRVLGQEEKRKNIKTWLGAEIDIFISLINLISMASESNNSSQITNVESVGMSLSEVSLAGLSEVEIYRFIQQKAIENQLKKQERLKNKESGIDKEHKFWDTQVHMIS